MINFARASKLLILMTLLPISAVKKEFCARLEAKAVGY